MQGIVTTISNFFQFLLNFLKPVTVFFMSVTGLVAFLVGALADPQGFANAFICGAIDMISGIFPSTPENLKIGSIIASVSSQVPAIGCAVLQDIVTTLASIFAIFIVVKIYKLIPFKAT